VPAIYTGYEIDIVPIQSIAATIEVKTKVNGQKQVQDAKNAAADFIFTNRWLDDKQKFIDDMQKFGICEADALLIYEYDAINNTTNNIKSLVLDASKIISSSFDFWKDLVVGEKTVCNNRFFVIPTNESFFRNYPYSINYDVMVNGKVSYKHIIETTEPLKLRKDENGKYKEILFESTINCNWAVHVFSKNKDTSYSYLSSIDWSNKKSYLDGREILLISINYDLLGFEDDTILYDNKNPKPFFHARITPAIPSPAGATIAITPSRSDFILLMPVVIALSTLGPSRASDAPTLTPIATINKASEKHTNIFLLNNFFNIL